MITTTDTQPPAAIAAISAFVPAIIALTAVTVALAAALIVVAVAFAVAFAACALFCEAFAVACAVFCAALAVCWIFVSFFDILDEFICKSNRMFVCISPTQSCCQITLWVTIDKQNLLTFVCKTDSKI